MKTMFLADVASKKEENHPLEHQL